MKRKTLLISLILILCILAGCSNNGGSEQLSSEPLSSSENAGKTISGTVVEVSLFNNSFVFDTIDSEKIQVKVSNSTEIDFLKKEEELPSESVSENTSSTETQNKEETINQGNVEVSIDNQAQGTEPSEAVSTQSQTETTSTGSQGNNATSDQSQKPSIRDIKEGDEVEVTFDEDGKTAKKVSIVKYIVPESINNGSASNLINKDKTIAGDTFSSIGINENALRINNAKVTASGIIIKKPSGDASNEHSLISQGINSALLVKGNSSAKFDGLRVTSSALNGNGVFACENKSNLLIDMGTIKTTGDNSSAVSVSYGAHADIQNTRGDTSGTNSPAINNSYSGGTIKLSDSSFTSTGKNSPVIYNKFDVFAENTFLTTTDSETVIIEDGGKTELKNCNILNSSSTSGATKSNFLLFGRENNPEKIAVAQFDVLGGNIVNGPGDVFRITNTEANINLTSSNIVSSPEEKNLFNVSGNTMKGWGTAGINGGKAYITTEKQKLEGRILVDNISYVSLDMKNNSYFKGSVNIQKNVAAPKPLSENVKVIIDKTSTWELTGDSMVTTLINEGKIIYNGHKITLADGTVLNK